MTDAARKDRDREQPSAEFLESLMGALDDTPLGVALFDTNLRLRRFNRAWEAHAARYVTDAPRLAPGVSLLELLPDQDEWLRGVRERLLRGHSLTQEGFPVVTEGGATSYWDLTLAPLADGDGVTGFIQIAVDATARVEALQQLESHVAERTAELERKSEVADGLHDILAILNSCCPTEQIMDYIVAQAKRLLGSEAVAVYQLAAEKNAIVAVGAHGMEDDLILDIAFPTNEGFVVQTLMRRRPMVVPDSTMLFGPITDRMHPDHRDRIHRVFTRYRALLAVPLVVSDEVWGGLAMYYPEPRPFSAEEISLASDLADHLALSIENATLREQAEESAATAERNRLARDLHDAVTQTLFSASLIAEVLPRLWERDEAEAQRRLEELRRLTRGALAEMRTLLLELRPAALVDADLAEVLGQLAEAAGTSGVHVRVEAEACPCRLPPDGQVALYRIAQEAVNNIVKHSGARNATLSLRVYDAGLVLEITDDGRGFAAGDASGEHLGMRIMRERAESVGAQLTVESDGEGTRVTVLYPVREREE